MKCIVTDEILKQDIMEIEASSLNYYSSLLKSNNLFAIINNRQMPIKYHSLISICHLCKLIPEEVILFALILKVEPIVSKTTTLVDDDTKFNMSTLIANSQRDILKKQEYRIPNYSIQKLESSSNERLEQIQLKSEYIPKNKVFSFILRSIYAIYFVYALLLSIEVIIFYIKKQVFDSLIYCI